MMGMGCGVGDGHGRKVCAVPEEGRGSFGAIYRPGMDSRVCQHVERFVKGTGRSMAEGRHLAHLLQVKRSPIKTFDHAGKHLFECI